MRSPHLPRNRPAAAGWSRYGWLALAGVVGLLWCTGVLMHQLADPQGLGDLPEWAPAWRHASTVLHGCLSWLLCIAIGRWIGPHVQLMWRRHGAPGRAHRGARFLGWLSAGSGVGILLGGLFLLYGSPPWRDALGALHWWLGLVWPLPLALHAVHRRWR